MIAEKTGGGGGGLYLKASIICASFLRSSDNAMEVLAIRIVNHDFIFVLTYKLLGVSQQV